MKLRRKLIPDKKKISNADLKDLIKKELKKNLRENFCLHMSDTEYYLPSIEEAKEIIGRSKMKNLVSHLNKERGERFDCDDFSLILKARFAYDAFRSKPEYDNVPSCIGIVWGMLPFPIPHSLNWMVTADENGDRQFHFIEPKNEEIIPPEKYEHYRYIHFMLV